MLKKFAIVVGSLFVVSMVACSGDNVAGGGSIDPNTFASESSSSGDIKTLPVSSAKDVVSSSGMSENNNGLKISSSSSSSKDAISSRQESSSSGEGNHTIRHDESSSSTRIVEESSSSDVGDNNGVDPIPVSSSSEIRDGGIARANDFFIQCIEDVIYVDLDAPTVAADVAPPEAFKHVDGDAVKFVLLGVYFDIPCDKSQRDEYIEFLNTESIFPMGHEGDTLLVVPYHGDGIAYDCSCAAKATFTLDKNYSGINYTVFGQKETLPVKEN